MSERAHDPLMRRRHFLLLSRSSPSAAAAHWSDISLDSKAAIPPQAKNFKHSISQSTGRGGEILTRHKRVTQGEDT